MVPNIILLGDFNLPESQAEINSINWSSLKLNPIWPTQAAAGSLLNLSSLTFLNYNNYNIVRHIVFISESWILR